MNPELDKQRAYWDGAADDFDAIHSGRKGGLAAWADARFRWDMRARFDYTMRRSEPIAGRTFLDVGCGTGRYSIEFAERGAARVVGLDIADNMLRVCRERAQAAKVNDRCEFVRSDLLGYPPGELFHVGIGIGLFDYIRDALPVLVRMRGTVTDRVIVSLPRFWTWRAPVRKIRLALRGCRVFFYRRGRVDALMKKAGFPRVEIEKVGQLWCVTGYV
jgi:SAM-dependent methyltransferase